MEGCQNKCCASYQFTACALHIDVYGFSIHHNPVWKQMCELSRHESVVEKNSRDGIRRRQLQAHCEY